MNVKQARTYLLGSLKLDELLESLKLDEQVVEILAWLHDLSCANMRMRFGTCFAWHPDFSKISDIDDATQLTNEQVLVFRAAINHFTTKKRVLQ